MRSLSFIGRRVARVATQTSFILGIAMIAMLWTGIALKFKDQSAGNYRDAVLNNPEPRASLRRERASLRRRSRQCPALSAPPDRPAARQRRPARHRDRTRNSSARSSFSSQSPMRSGMLRASNSRAAAASADQPQRPRAFRFHRESSTDKLYVGRPVVGRVSGQWLVPLTRRLMNPDGSFGGVVVASLNPEHFTEFYQSIDLGQSGSISLIGLDGRVRSSGGRRSRPLALGQDITGSRLLNEVRSGAMPEPSSTPRPRATASSHSAGSAICLWP